MSRHRARDVVKVCWPSAPRLELVGCFVEGRVAGRAGVDAAGGHVFVVFAGEGRFCAFFADDAELFWGSLVSTFLHKKGEGHYLSRERLAIHRLTFGLDKTSWLSCSY